MFIREIDSIGWHIKKPIDTALTIGCDWRESPKIWRWAGITITLKFVEINLCGLFIVLYIDW